MIRLKNILAENMLRFGPKNLSESDKRNLQRLTESIDKNLKQLTDYAAAYKHFAASITKNITTSAPFIGTETIWIGKPVSNETARMEINIFYPQTFSIMGFQFIIPSSVNTDNPIMFTTNSSERRYGGVWFYDPATTTVSLKDQTDYNGLSGTTTEYEIDSAYSIFTDYGGTAADLTSFIQKNASKFDLAAIKSQANFSTITAKLKNSVAKEITKTIGA
jgi:hypothetical protein